MHNFKSQKLKQFIDGIAIDLWFSRNFVRMEDIRRRYNPMVKFSKFTSNKKILSNIVILPYNQFCS